jgi:hypothetical protein
MPGEELSIELIEHLRAALAIAVKLGDKSAVYMVERALSACRRRWEEPAEKQAGAFAGESVRRLPPRPSAADFPDAVKPAPKIRQHLV